MNKENDVQDKTRAVLKAHGIGVLASIGGESPHQGLVAFAASEDLKTIVFATPVYTRKYENILKNTSVSLLVDNRTRPELDFQTYSALTVKGVASVLNNEESEELLPLYLGRHPYLADFVGSPSSALVRVEVLRYSLVSSFQHVQEWSP
jgi:nitroimidazol reductase NimA-like FMN-containing flavoprotein (pyridoxamine 5'-phosphate oxidase superfamily)